MVQKYYVKPGELLYLDFVSRTFPIHDTFHRFKRFDRVIFRYRDGHRIVARLFPDGHREIEVERR